MATRSSTGAQPAVHRLPTGCTGSRHHPCPQLWSPAARSRPALDELGELVDLFVDLPALRHLLLDLVDRVDHGRVIALAERLGDLREREVGELATDVHRDLAG